MFYIHAFLKVYPESSKEQAKRLSELMINFQNEVNKNYKKQELDTSEHNCVLSHC